ncbi:MAG: type IX secretion system membrane protein PorP/SprF [Cytophagaceae bacterium]|jgi:type IX secretion system PorP/SprF family membrane protein|nr:type IX secretion system membrane protein PorP/SprF [Cytophagaceae bacterium]
MKNVYYLFFFSILASNLLAQQDAHYSQYMFNGLLINPAMAGSKDAISGAIYHRSQWSQADEAPTYQSFSVHAPFSYQRIGIGFIFLKEKVFETSIQTLGLSASYKINVRKGWMSFGLQGGLRRFQQQFNDLQIKDADDPVLSDQRTGTTPDLGSGVFYQNKKWYAGLSTQHLLPWQPAAGFQLRPHLYGTLARKFKLSPTLTLIPSTLLKWVNGSVVQADISTHIKFKEVAWGGISWRSSEALAWQMGLALEGIFPTMHQSVKIGYAYDAHTGMLASRLGNSHELMLIWDLKIPEKISAIRKRVPSVSPLFF